MPQVHEQNTNLLNKDPLCLGMTLPHSPYPNAGPRSNKLYLQKQPPAQFANKGQFANKIFF